MADCLFCKIIAGTVPSKRVHDDALCIGFHDIAPHAPTHALFIPRKHIATVNDLEADDEKLVGHLFTAAAAYARAQGFADAGYRLVVNCNRDAGQTVFHLHLHVLAGRPFTFPPG